MMAKMSINSFIGIYGNQIPPEELIVLIAAANYFNSYPADATGDYKRTPDPATIDVSYGDVAATKEKNPGEFELTLLSPGGSGNRRIPVAGIPGVSIYDPIEAESDPIEELQVTIDMCAIDELIDTGHCEPGIYVL